VSVVHFNLANYASLAGMVPAALAGGLFAPAALPAALAGAGMYLIVNTNTNNRYIGISTTLNQRFNTRMATVTEMGLSAGNMANVEVYWGAVTTQNTPAPAVAGEAPVALPPAVPLAGCGAPLKKWRLMGLWSN